MMHMIKRKLKEEVGLGEILHMSFLGIYEHFYPDSVVSLEISIHYIAITFGFQILDKSLIRTCDQHEEFQFITREKALKSDPVPIPIENYLQGEFENYLGLNIIN